MEEIRGDTVTDSYAIVKQTKAGGNSLPELRPEIISIRAKGIFERHKALSLIFKKRIALVLS